MILDRLVFRKHYGLAIHIAKHLKLPESRILEHWAFHKVIHDKSEYIRSKISLLSHPNIHSPQMTKKWRKKSHSNLEILKWKAAFRFVTLPKKRKKLANENWLLW